MKLFFPSKMQFFTKQIKALFMKINLRINYFSLFCRYIVEIRPSPFDLTIYLIPFAVVVGVCFLLMVFFVVRKLKLDERIRICLFSKSLK